MRVRLVEPEGRVRRHRPPAGVVRQGARTADLVEVRTIPLELLLQPGSADLVFDEAHELEDTLTTGRGETAGGCAERTERRFGFDPALRCSVQVQVQPVRERLHRREQVGGAQGQAFQAERVGGVGLLRGDHPAAGPLIAPVLAAEDHLDDLTIAIQQGGPHVEAESAVLFLEDRLKLGAEHVVLGQVLAKHYTAPEQTVTVAHYAESLAREKATEKKEQKIADTSMRRTARAKEFKAWLGRYEDPWFGEVVLCAERGKIRFRAPRSPMLTGTVMQVGTRWLVDWDEVSVDAEPWLDFAAAESSQPIRLKLSHVDPDADFSYDYADLDFARVGDCR